MSLDQPILAYIRTGGEFCGAYYANVQGVHPRISIGVYFNGAGEMIAHTIRNGKDAQTLLSKLHAEIARRGVELAEAVA